MAKTKLVKQGKTQYRSSGIKNNGQLSTMLRNQNFFALQRAYSSRRQGELKGLDTLLTVNPVPATTDTGDAFFLLNCPGSGSLSYQRIGRKIFPKYVYMKGLVSHAFKIATNNYASNTLRMVLIWDKQPSGALPAWQDVFRSTAFDGTSNSYFDSPRNYINMDRFRVLMDKKIISNKLSEPTAEGSVVITYDIDDYLKLPNGLETVFAANTGNAIASVSSGALYVAFRAVTNITSNFMIVDEALTMRVRYTD